MVEEGAIFYILFCFLFFLYSNWVTAYRNDQFLKGMVFINNRKHLKRCENQWCHMTWLNYGDILYNYLSHGAKIEFCCFFCMQNQNSKSNLIVSGNVGCIELTTALKAVTPFCSIRCTGWFCAPLWPFTLMSNKREIREIIQMASLAQVCTHGFLLNTQEYNHHRGRSLRNCFLTVPVRCCFRVSEWDVDLISTMTHQCHQMVTFKRSHCLMGQAFFF